MISTPAARGSRPSAARNPSAKRVSIAVKRRGLRLSQRFELWQQGLVEPGEVQEENCEDRRERAVSSSHQRQAYTPEGRVGAHEARKMRLSSALNERREYGG